MPKILTTATNDYIRENYPMVRNYALNQGEDICKENLIDEMRAQFNAVASQSGYKGPRPRPKRPSDIRGREYNPPVNYISRLPPPEVLYAPRPKQPRRRKVSEKEEPRRPRKPRTKRPRTTRPRQEYAMGQPLIPPPPALIEQLANPIPPPLQVAIIPRSRPKSKRQTYPVSRQEFDEVMSQLQAETYVPHLLENPPDLENLLALRPPSARPRSKKLARQPEYFESRSRPSTQPRASRPARPHPPPPYIPPSNRPRLPVKKDSPLEAARKLAATIGSVPPTPSGLSVGEGKRRKKRKNSANLRSRS